MNRYRALPLLLAIALLSACKSDPPVAGPVEIGPGAVETSAPAQPQGQSGASAASAVAEPDPSAQPAGERYTIDGLVGQVNGQPIYARTILDPLHEQLTQLARQYAGHEYRRATIEAISLRVREVVQNALILGEAERDLNEQERQVLTYRVEEHRQELLRRYGRGSAAVAEQELRERRGMGLNEALDAYRTQIVVGRYLREKLFPRINVTRRDIERYYHENAALFNPPARRVIRLINVPSHADAQAISDVLASADADFAELASGELNRFKPADGGRMELTGDASLAVTAINERLPDLEPGEYAGPYQGPGGDFWFVYVESIDRPASRSLTEAQVDIENTLRERRFRLLREQFLQRVVEQGSFTPMEQMIERLYAIAEARYKASLAGSP